MPWLLVTQQVTVVFLTFRKRAVFLCVVLKILGSISGYKTRKNSAKIWLRNRRSIWQNSNLL